MLKLNHHSFVCSFLLSFVNLKECQLSDSGLTVERLFSDLPLSDHFFLWYLVYAENDNLCRQVILTIWLLGSFCAIIFLMGSIWGSHLSCSISTTLLRLASGQAFAILLLRNCVLPLVYSMMCINHRIACGARMLGNGNALIIHRILTTNVLKLKPAWPYILWDQYNFPPISY